MAKFIIVILSFLLSAVAQAESKKALNIVVTTGMIKDLVQNIAKNRGSVSGLIGAGIDPHLYKPTRTDIAKLSGADLVFYNGLLLEGKMTDALIRVASSGRPVIAVTELLDSSELLEPADFQGHYDPHLWMDPRAWSKTIDLVCEKLSAHDKESAAYFHQNAEAYKKELQALDQFAETAAASIPTESRILVTAHDAFNYFGKRYGLEVIGIQGLSTESEAGVKDIERIVSILVERKVKAVFIESTVSPRNVQALIEGAAARNHTVRIGGQLFSDAMGAEGTYEGTYIGMIDHNVTTIVSALGGKVSPGGMKNRLSRKES